MLDQPQVTNGLTGQALGRSFDILIIGGGSAGLTVAAMLRGKVKGSIAIVDPTDTNAYQPGWTMVGAGVFNLAQTIKPEAALIPKGVEWIKKPAASFDPDHNRVALADGTQLGYRFLIVCPGLQLDWGKIEGLTETIGKNGVCSNYRGDLAAYTWECIKSFKSGKMIFTQPPMPIKCPGAPQKIAYLAADHLRLTGKRAAAEIAFCTALPTLFGVVPFVPPLKAAMKRHGIEENYKTNLKAIDGKAKKAIFTVTAADDTTSEVVRDFDMIHVTPPQSAPDFLKGSPIANAAGFVDVDQHSMQHLKYKNVFSLGDAASTPNSKTLAALRLQAPVVVRNLVAAMKSEVGTASYDGYGSCPLTTDYGRIVLAEFIYGGKVTPSFPLDPRVPRYSSWWLKKDFLPFLYWQVMLRGIDLDIGHRERVFADAA
ncbi:MAG: FAD/NAD(P)-binding oxidoreductase [Acidiphilium sp.]|nr:FAD/NAD(P)-binding oxidoreductase [Acidiphilium sp.]MDD4934625.1 FAD/NAD(P)-binding oxidoreductase [Acidiphilium sp.]